MKIKIEALGKFGPKIGDGSFLSNYDKNFPTEKFVVGAEYDVVVQMSKKSGKPYISEVKGPLAAPTVAKAPAPAPKAEAPVPAVPEVKAAPKAWGRELSEYELDKDKRISAAGILQAVIESPHYAQEIALQGLKGDEADNYLVDKARVMLGKLKDLAS